MLTAPHTTHRSRRLERRARSVAPAPSPAVRRPPPAVRRPPARPPPAVRQSPPAADAPSTNAESVSALLQRVGSGGGGQTGRGRGFPDRWRPVPPGWTLCELRLGAGGGRVPTGGRPARHACQLRGGCLCCSDRMSP